MLISFVFFNGNIPCNFKLKAKSFQVNTSNSKQNYRMSLLEHHWVWDLMQTRIEYSGCSSAGFSSLHSNIRFLKELGKWQSTPWQSISQKLLLRNLTSLTSLVAVWNSLPERVVGINSNLIFFKNEICTWRKKNIIWKWE